MIDERELRGIVFEKSSGKVIARRFHKFFNIGEYEETSESKIDLNLPHHIVTKYDGLQNLPFFSLSFSLLLSPRTLVSPVKINGNIVFASKSGDQKLTKMIRERYLLDMQESEDNSLISFCKDWIERGYTPLFEWCSLRTKIVLEYEKDLLVLLAIRNNHTGNYVPYSKVKESASNYKNVKVAERWEGSIQANKNMNEWIQKIKSEEKIEGFVIQFEDGRMYKVKTNWYFERTRKDKQDYSFNSERNIWLIILKQEIDDAGAYMDKKLSKIETNSFSLHSFSLFKQK